MFSDYYDHTSRSYARHKGCEQWEWEAATLAGIVELRQPANILEIGSWIGGTLSLWARANPNAKLISIDNQTDIELPAQFKHVHMQANSHDPATLTRVKALMPAVDFLFIDGDHTYAGAKQDFEMYAPLVRADGFIAFHDILDPAPHRNQDHIRVSKLWREIQAAGYITTELIAHPGQEWGGIGVVLL